MPNPQPAQKPKPRVPLDLLEWLEQQFPESSRLTEKVLVSHSELLLATGARRLVCLLRDLYTKQQSESDL